MAKRERAGINFAALAKISFFVLLVNVIWAFVPATMCSFRGMDDETLQTDEELEDLEDSLERGRSSDVTRVQGATGFISRFKARVGPCFSDYGLSTAPEWQQKTIYVSGGAFVLFLILNLTFKRRSYVG